MNTHLKLSFRALWAKKSFSLLNILGLAIGIGASLLIFLVIRNEMSYDNYQSKRNRIYRVVSTERKFSNDEITSKYTMVAMPLPDAFRQEFPQMETVGRMHTIGGAQIYIPGKNGAEEMRVKEVSRGQYFVEPQLFDIFDVKWIIGNAAEMKMPNTAVISESRAIAYFGSAQAAMDKTIQLWSYRVPLRVTGVFKDLPKNTDVPFELAASFETLLSLGNGSLREKAKDNWSHLIGGSQCFVVLKPGTDPKSIASQFPRFVTTHYKEQEKKQYTYTQLFLQPLTTMHMDPEYDLPYTNRIAPREMWSLALIGVFLLLVACINFINLATAQSVNRAKEVGVRKALGSNRVQLLRQFLFETGLITLLALIIGTVMAVVSLPSMSHILGKPIVLNGSSLPVIIVFLILTGVIVTFLAGFYPGLVLSGFNPVMALKSRIRAQQKGGVSLRRGLVIFQFVIAQLLVIGTIVVVKQMQYFRNQSMGFRKEAVLMIDLPSDSALKLKYRYLEDRFAALPGVKSVTLCNNAPSTRSGYYTSIQYDTRAEKENFSVKQLMCDSGYYKTFDLKLAAGRYIFGNDSMREALVNETLVKKLGLKSNEEIIGKMITIGEKTIPVVGVLKDYHNNPLDEQIWPSVVTSEFNAYAAIVVSIDPQRVMTTADQIRKTFTAVYPTYLYDYAFMDDQIAQFYESAAVVEQLFKVFAFLAILISCLGLYGLVSFMAVQKNKEVGIRKVLGASVQSILYLFSKEFTILIGVAFLVAAPLGYFFMNNWLQGYYYHIELGWGVFVLAIVLSIVIAWITVGYKAIKAALANPINSLRSE
ncbi:ABC transporter permease [Chitinophaga sp. LS1]|uniref:ABC transporter permease n=1 Tax=Chitinophaga sp. LS1 TaxID=3051176 RepID=UPI002AAC2FF8|nr:ABC transporter permease [Chitinophaga sp. LS1]WPV64981.1 ABC transporter permease [Chitinophaga sp. LS1]